MADVHDYLCGGVQHQNLCGPGELRIIRHHGNRVDDRRCVEHRLEYDLPDVRHIAEVYEQRSEQQRHA